MSAIASVLLVVADDDRPVVRSLADALAEVGSDVVDDVTAARAAVVFASTRAASSARVNDLLTRWAAQHAMARTIVVLLDGELFWDAQTNAFDVAATTALPPVAQRAFATRPLWLDARGGFSAPLVTRLVAALVPDAVARCSVCDQVVTRGTIFCPACGAFRGAFSGGVHDAVGPAPMALPADTAAPRPPLGLRRGRAPGILVATCVVVAIVVLIGLVVLGRADSSPSIAPNRPSGLPGWLLGAAGLAVGLILGIALTAKRHRSNRPTITSATSRSLSSTASLPSPPHGDRRALVFISHNVNTEHQLALQVADDLRNDADVWVAPESIAAGESWVTSIERGLGTCQIFIALLSRAALESPWVLKEVQAAMELEVQRRLRLLPMQVEECELPILLRTYQVARLPHGYTQFIEQTRRLARST